MLKILNALKDIPGVVGSFVLGDEGALLCREMPAIYPDAIFSELGRRLIGVKDAVETQAPPFADLLLKSSIRSVCSIGAPPNAPSASSRPSRSTNRPCAWLRTSR